LAAEERNPASRPSLFVSVTIAEYLWGHGNPRPQTADASDRLLRDLRLRRLFGSGRAEQRAASSK
jgi:hypothetical protein